MAKSMNLHGKLSSRYKGIASLWIVLLVCSAQVALADNWSLTDKDGVKLTLAGLQGKWVLVNFWAPWCPPCIQEMPELDSIQNHHKDLQVIGVAVMYGSRKEVTEVLTKQSVSYPIVYGNEDTAGDFGGIDGLPTSFLYSPTGKLVGHHQGPLTQRELEQVIGSNSGNQSLFVR
ncbi:MAG: TlpA disulfide reductase family protein [Gallionella sp.]